MGISGVSEAVYVGVCVCALGFNEAGKEAQCVFGWACACMCVVLTGQEAQVCVCVCACLRVCVCVCWYTLSQAGSFHSGLEVCRRESQLSGSPSGPTPRDSSSVSVSTITCFWVLFRLVPLRFHITKNNFCK